MYINLGAFCADCPWGGLQKRSETGGVRRAYPPLVETLVVAVRYRADLCTEGYVSTPESGLCPCGTRPVSPAMWGEWPKWRVRARPDGCSCRANHSAPPLKPRLHESASGRQPGQRPAAAFPGGTTTATRGSRTNDQKFPPPRTRGGGTKGGGDPISFA